MAGLLATILLAYLGGLFALSVYANRRVESEEDYLVAGRRLPLGLAWGTLLATWFGAATILGAADAARTEGVRGTVLDPFASGMALIVAGLFFARPLWEMKLLTLADFYGRVFGSKAEIAASLIMVPGYFGWIAAQYVALAGIETTFFGIPEQWGILVACAIVLAYTLMGGMWSVTLTDTLQISVVLATLLVLAGATLLRLGSGSLLAGLHTLHSETPAEMLTLLPAAGAVSTVGWLATWGNGIFGNIPGQDLMQRVFASRSATTAKCACLIAGVVYIGFGILPVGLGLSSRLLSPNDQEGSILASLAQQYLTPTLSAVFVVSLVSIIVSTSTSAVLSPAAVLGHNLLGRIPRLQGKPLLVDRVSVFLVAAAGVAVAYSGKTIMELLELSLSIGVVSLFVPLVAGIYGKPRGELPAMLAMALGIAVWIPREAMELALLPQPEDVGMDYPDYVFERVSASAGSLLGNAIYFFALLPSAASGTAMSFLGYTAGQALCQRKSLAT